MVHAIALCAKWYAILTIEWPLCQGELRTSPSGRQTFTQRWRWNKAGILRGRIHQLFDRPFEIWYHVPFSIQELLWWCHGNCYRAWTKEGWCFETILLPCIVCLVRKSRELLVYRDGTSKGKLLGQRTNWFSVSSLSLLLPVSPLSVLSGVSHCKWYRWVTWK